MTSGTRAGMLAYFAAAYAATAALQKGIGFLAMLWLAHSLSVEAYATFGLLFALQTGLAALTGAGVMECVIGLLKEHRADERRAELFRTAGAVFAMLALAAVTLTALLSGFIRTQASASIADIVWVLLGGIATAHFSFQAQLVRLEEDHRSSLLLGFLPALAGWLVGLWAFSRAQSVTAFFAGMAIALLVCLAGFAIARVGHYGWMTQLRRTVPILSRLGPFLLIVVVVWLSGYGSTYLVKGFFDETQVARFTFAYTLSAIMQLVVSSLNQVWSPRFFRTVHQHSAAEVERSNRRFFAFEGLVLGAIGGGVLALVPLVMELIGSGLAAYRDLTLELFLLFAAYAVSIPWYHAQNYYYAYDRGRQLMSVTVLTTATGMLGWLLAMELLGVVGIYVGFVLVMAARSAGAFIGAHRHWRVGFLYEGPLIALGLLAAGALAAGWLAKLVP